MANMLWRLAKKKKTFINLVGAHFFLFSFFKIYRIREEKKNN